MDIIFDQSALTYFRCLGYCYFCSLPMVDHMPRGVKAHGAYLELIPFRLQYDAYEFYLAHKGVNGALLLEKDYLEELADGIFGLVVYIRSVDELL